MIKHFIRTITTFFFIGYFPLMPGSMASIAGAVIAVALRKNLSLYLLAWIVITVLGFLFSGKMEKIEGAKDPSCVVIDEVSGVMIAFFLLPPSFSVWITAFFLFRAFDMFKIFPGNFFEKKQGSFGIMMDDVVAGLYARIIIYFALQFMSFI